MTALARLLEACERATGHLHATYSDSLADGCDPSDIHKACPVALELDRAAETVRKEMGEACHWYVEPRRVNPAPFCVTNKADRDAAEWHEKAHCHKVTPLFSVPPDAVPRAEVERLAASLKVYMHAYRTDNRIPMDVERDAAAALKACGMDPRR